MTSLDLAAPVIIGFGITGQAVARVLAERGHPPVVIDDRPSDDGLAVAAQRGFSLTVAPDSDQLAAIVSTATVLLPSPGIPDHHPVFEVARRLGVPVHSEFDLAALWDRRPRVGITGTNGKTTVTIMVTEALNRSGLRAEAVGNTPTPLVAALADDTIDVFVVEASSFRLAHSSCFAPQVATWMNFSPDHLDAHSSLAIYEAAKASIWAHLPRGGIAIANAEDPVVMKHVPQGSPVVTFGLERGDWRIEHDHVVGPEGPLVATNRLARRQPHDLANATCMAATAIAAGATPEAVIETLEQFEGLPHRVSLVGEWDGIRWFNDSKATVPQATLAAVSGFSSVVLIAGGRNKGLDLSSLATSVPPVHTVVAIGDAEAEIASVFAQTDAAVVTATTMSDAITAARAAARPGDTVLLSPACTSFDWYANYGERGDDFTREVTERFHS